MKTGIGIATIAGIAMGLGTAAHAESLADALAAAYQNNPTLLAQRASLRATDETLSQAVAGWRPTITDSASAGYTKQPSFFSQITGTGGGTQILNSRSNQISINQPIFDGLQTPYRVKQANRQILAGRAQLEATEQNIFLQTVTAYVDVIQYLAVLELDANNITVLQRTLEATRDQFRVVIAAFAPVAAAITPDALANGCGIAIQLDHGPAVQAADQRGGLPHVAWQTVHEQQVLGPNLPLGEKLVEDAFGDRE